MIMEPSMHQSSQKKEKTERLEARINPKMKALIQKAADLEGRKLSEFIINSSQREAKKIIREHEVLSLSKCESERFVNALLTPPKPNKALTKAAKRQANVISRKN
jgi:uncharacterized protein (DUF1778 family)